MAIADIPIRVNGQRITASWFNTIRSELLDIVGSSLGQNNFTIDNNTTAALSLTIDGTVIKAFEFQYVLERYSDTDPRVNQQGSLRGTYDGTTWTLIDGNLSGGDAGTTFAITQSDPNGQLSYTSSNYDPTGYIGRLDLLGAQFEI